MVTPQQVIRADSRHQRPLDPPVVNERWPASAIWRSGEPQVRSIGFADLKDALVKGIDDFNAAPTHALFLLLFYPVVGLMLFRFYAGEHLLPLVYPLLAGLALLGPVAAVGFYELSRRREQGLDVSIWHVVQVYKSPRIGSIVTLGVVMLAIFVAWMLTAQALYTQTFRGAIPGSFAEFMAQLDTPAGSQLIFSGNAIGFVYAVVALMISVFSFPMLLDRDVGVATAVRTSVRAVLENPVTMAVWGLLVVGLLIAGAIPFFFGLAIVFPVLGHATWHLYRKAISHDLVR